MNISITNCSFMNCGKDIVAHKSVNLIASELYFEKVDTCIEIRNDDYKYLENQTIGTIKLAPTSYNLKHSSKSLEKQSQNIIRDLFNLEIKFKCQKDFKSLTIIRMLKGIVGSKKFHHQYASLKSNL